MTRAEERRLRALERKLRPYVTPDGLHRTRFEEGQRAAYGNVWKEIRALLPKRKRLKTP